MQPHQQQQLMDSVDNGGDNNNDNENIGLGGFAVSGSHHHQQQCMGLEDDALTALTLGPPGGSSSININDSSAERTESLPAGFWDAMRGVIAREVRDYMSSTLSGTSGFH